MSIIKFKMASKCFVCVFLLLVVVSQSKKLSYPDFCGMLLLKKLQTNMGDHQWKDDSKLVMTRSGYADSASSVWLEEKFFVKGFSTEFTFKITDITGSGGDGIVFVIQVSLVFLQEVFHYHRYNCSCCFFAILVCNFLSCNLKNLYYSRMKRAMRLVVQRVV